MPGEHRTSGELLRSVRLRAGWTLKQMSERSGIPFSTLSKMEHGRLALSYNRLVLLSENLGLPLPDLVSDCDRTGEDGAPGIGEPAHDFAIRTLDRHPSPAREIAPRKLMAPAVARIRTKRIDRPDALIRHAGEGYLYVVAGQIEVHTEYYDRLILDTGESVYLDADMGHACTVGQGCEEATIVTIYSKG